MLYICVDSMYNMIEKTIEFKFCDSEIRKTLMIFLKLKRHFHK